MINQDTKYNGGNHVVNYLTKNKRSKDKTSPLEEYEMKRKEKGFSLHDIAIIPLRELSSNSRPYMKYATPYWRGGIFRSLFSSKNNDKSSIANAV